MMSINIYFEKNMELSGNLIYNPLTQEKNKCYYIITKGNTI